MTTEMKIDTALGYLRTLGAGLPIDPKGCESLKNRYMFQWCSGSTTDSKPVSVGSIPTWFAIKKQNARL